MPTKDKSKNINKQLKYMRQQQKKLWKSMGKIRNADDLNNRRLMRRAEEEHTKNLVEMGRLGEELMEDFTGLHHKGRPTLYEVDKLKRLGRKKKKRKIKKRR